MLRPKFFEYGIPEISYLKQVDKILGEAINRLGKVERCVIPDLFQALIYAMIGQQISVKAAHTIWSRMQDRFNEITPQSISKGSAQAVQQCGTTTRKAEYIYNIANKISQRDFDMSVLYHLPDDEIIRRLSSLEGVGVWTAEMVLLNSMERPNIVSWKDIAIRRGMMKLYNLSELTQEQFAEYKNTYSPYGSVASIYLWQISSE
jgi:DNA-3-methyladenine glycosylase II